MRVLTHALPQALLWLGVAGVAAVAPAFTAPATLQVLRTTGRAEFRQGSLPARPLRVGDRFAETGDRAIVGAGGTATIALNASSAEFHLADSTELVLRRLDTGSAGQTICHLTLGKGWLRSRVAKFQNAASELKLSTPVGVAALEAAEATVAVHPNGKTVVAVRAGTVRITAAQRAMVLPAGNYVQISPAGIPSAPLPASESTVLQLERLARAGERVELLARTAPENLVYVNDRGVSTNAEGRFGAIAVPEENRLRIIVRTPAGQVQAYSIAVPSTVGTGDFTIH